MNNFTVYCAQPIDFGATDSGLVYHAQGEMAALGWTVYDPKSAFSSVAPQPDGAVSTINLAAMGVATGAVAFMPADARTVGVPAEIGHLLAKGVPVLIVSDIEKSWVLDGWRGQAGSDVVGFTLDEVSEGLDWLRDTMRANTAIESLPHQRGAADAVVFERKHPNATLPTKGYPTDAGFDLYAVEDVVIPARGQGQVSCGVAIDIPDGMWAQITGRSSTLKKRSLMVAPTTGVIDQGFTGELFAPIVSLSDADTVVRAGERVAQIILHEAPGQRFTPSWGVCRESERGSAGFGSTGRDASGTPF